MTSEQLTAIEARALAATPGPWYPRATDDELCRVALYVGLDSGPTGRGLDGVPDHDDGSLTDVTPERLIAITRHQSAPACGTAEARENTVFIALAREDVLALVAEVRRLRAAGEAR